MTGLYANTSAMNNNGKDTVAQAEYFANELSSLRSNVERLMTIWKGLSANEFNGSYEEQSRNLNNFQQLLNDLGEGISRSADILNRAEEENASAGSHLF